MMEQSAIVLLNSLLKPIYVSTAAATILLERGYTNIVSAKTAIVAAVDGLIAEGSPQGENGGFGFLDRGGHRYLWNITRCDEWRAEQAPSNFVLIFRRADLPEAKIKAICTQFRLSMRQEQTLVYLFQGLTSKEIAQLLDLSPNTVKIHIRALMSKLHVTTRTALVGRVLSASDHSTTHST